MLALFAATALLVQPKVELDVVYATVADTPLKVDLYYPTTSKPGPTPAVVVFHGGAWISGQKKDMGTFCAELAKRGIFAATFQYRLAPKHKYPAMLEDAQLSVKWLRANSAKYNIDPSRIGSAGASAGAHLALLVGNTENLGREPYAIQSSRTSVVFNMFAPVDMTVDFPKEIDPLVMAVMGKKREEAATEIKAASPFYYLTKNSPPTYIYHGKVDTVVPFQQAIRLENKLKELGVEVQTAYLDNIGHEVKVEDPASLKALEGGFDFLVKHLEP